MIGDLDAAEPIVRAFATMFATRWYATWVDGAVLAVTPVPPVVRRLARADLEAWITGGSAALAARWQGDAT